MGFNETAWGGSEGTFWEVVPFPSGYSMARIIATAALVSVIIVVVIVGNLLVILAIARIRALKGAQNWFIASLAVADFLVGLIIMPFSLAQELMGYWVFGELWCNLHAAIDVLACTSSINNICLISLDRYWSITRAVGYLKHRDPRRAAALIAFVWVFSAAICIPPLLGWRQTPLPSNNPRCELSHDVGYVVYSALGSFYVPSVIMLFVYARIYQAARSRARRYVRKKHLDITISTVALADMHHVLPSAGDTESHKSSGGSEAASQSGQRHSLRILRRRPTKTPRSPTRIPEDAVLFEDPASAVNGADLLSPPAARIEVELNSGVNSPEAATSSDPTDSVSLAPITPSNHRGSRFTWKRASSAVTEDASESISMAEIPTRNPKAKKILGVNPGRDRRRLARKKEKRATLILGLIMGSFIACWLPFFLLYVLMPLCHSCDIPKWGFAVAFWLGYVNSAINPVIYTIFNKDYRQAFRKLLFK